LSSNLSAIDPHHNGHFQFDANDETDHFGSARSAFDLRYIAAAIRANLWLIGAIVVAALAIALVATMLQTKRYTASATIQINDSSGRLLGAKDDTTDEQATYYDIDRFLKTQTDIIQSRALALRVAQKLNLIGSSRLYEAQGLPAPASDTAPETLREQAVTLMAENLSVKLPRDSRIVSINYVSNDSELSARIANAYASEFIQSNLDRKFDSSSYARTYLEGQLTEAKQRLENSERALNAYAREAGIIRTGDGIVENEGGKSTVNRGTSVTNASLAQLNLAANEATARRIEAEGRWRAISSGSLLSSSLVLQNSTVAGLLSERARVQAELSQDRAQHLDDYPSVRARAAQLATIDQQIASVAGSVRNSVRHEYQAALATETALGAQVDHLKNATMSEQDRAVQYNLLAREADTNRQLYEGLLERYKTLNATARVSLSNVSIIDNAEAPKEPSSPNLFKNLLAGLICGIGLAAMVVFFKDQFDDAIRVPEDIETKLTLPLLGVVPQLQRGELQDALLDPKSPISEAYNSLRGSLLYATTQGLPQVMLVTSAQAAEGKTTSSLAIASGFARMGKNVLLIDADLRRPSLHKRLGVSGERGLSNLLTSHDPLSGIVQKSGQDYLSLVVAGPVPPSPTELLSTARIEEILQEAAGQFDVVVIDSPPILGLADAPLIAALVDGVVFVVEADRSRRGSLKAALRRLRAMRPILLGGVLTKFDPLKSGNRYSEYYGYDYYQYQSSDKAD